MALIVQKYGGSSVADADKIRNVAARIINTKEDKNAVVVVVSAQGDTTDNLISMAKEINPEPSNREMDMLLATGEQISISLLAMAIESLGQQVVSLTGQQVGIETDSVHSNAKILTINTNRIMKEINEGKIVIVAGFQGIDSNNNITTLGRGGSDTTAVAVAAAIKADMCEIYTDVDGVYTCDPRVVKDASKLNEISYDEMLELASVGAKVLHNRSVELAKNYNVKLVVRSSFEYKDGTDVKEVNGMEEIMVRGVAFDKDMARIAVIGVKDKPGMACKLFRVLADHNINVDIIIQSIGREKDKDISFTVAKGNLKPALKLIEEMLDELGAREVKHKLDVAKVSIVGAGMINHPGVAAMMFEALAEVDINIGMISTSEIRISCLIDEKDAEKAVNVIHKKFNLDKIK